MKVVIIGNGISGITAARYIRKQSDHSIQIISSESKYFFSRTALMYIYMGHMTLENTQPYEDWFWEKNSIDLINDHVEDIQYDKKQLKLKSGGFIQYDKLIIAVGSKPNKFGWPGQDLKGVQGLYTLQDLESMETFSKNLNRAIIVGGGLIGIEMAEMFLSRNIPVTFLVREKQFWDIVLPKEEAEMISRHIIEHHVDLRLETELKEIVDDGNGKVRAVITNKGEKIDCGFVGLTPGVHPNVHFLKETGLEIQRGILVNEYLETNQPDVYAIGDCAELRQAPPGRRNIEAVWYVGRIMGETVAYNVCGKNKKYDPGIWFNSAKFLDIEYQVYGNISTRIEKNQDYIYWEHPDGRKSIRILYDKETSEIIGFNLMGIRYRHEVCEKWLSGKTKIEEVLKQLSLANFDPEFFEEYEQALIDSYQQKTGNTIQKTNKRSWNQVFNFLQQTQAR